MYKNTLTVHRYSKEDFWVVHWDYETLVETSCFDPGLVWEGLR